MQYVKDDKSLRKYYMCGYALTIDSFLFEECETLTNDSLYRLNMMLPQHVYLVHRFIADTITMRHYAFHTITTKLINVNCKLVVESEDNNNGLQVRGGIVLLSKECIPALLLYLQNHMYTAFLVCLEEKMPNRIVNRIISQYMQDNYLDYSKIIKIATKCCGTFVHVIEGNNGCSVNFIRMKKKRDYGCNHDALDL